MTSKSSVRREPVYIVLILVLAVALAFSFIQNNFVVSSQNEAVENVKDVYELLTESEVEVLKVDDVGSLYNVLLRMKLSTGDMLTEVFASKDGKYFSEAANVIESAGFAERLTREKDFAECLFGKKLLVFGVSNEQNTAQQLLEIGNFATKIYVDCVGTNLQICQQVGIQTIPTIVYEGRNYTGPVTRNWISDLTGCEY
jgi:hypothetical protein